MPAWSVLIDRGAEVLTLDTNVRFVPKIDKRLDGEGNVEAVEVNIRVFVTVRSDSPTTVATTVMETYLNQVMEEHDDCTIIIKRDGTEYLRLEPEDAFVGPHVVGFETLDPDEGGAGESRWKCVFTISAIMKGVQTSPGEDPVYELHSSIETTKKNVEVIRKVWRIDAQSTSTEAAEGIVKAFGPGPQKSIVESITPHFEDARCTGVWVWERETQDGVLSHRCMVRSSGGRAGYVGVGMPGKGRDAVLFLKQRTPLRIHVRGTIIKNTPEIAPPAPHFTESPTLYRATEEEQDFGDVEIHDEKRGEYKLDYEEVWYSIGETPSPDHHGHDRIPKAAAPSD
jgi:hypothetical protein